MAQVTLFLALAFAISTFAFVGIAMIPGAQSPESGVGLPVWLLAVWGPSLAAMILAARAGKLPDLLSQIVETGAVPVSVWLLALSPLVVLLVAAISQGGFARAEVLTVGLMVKLVALNMILGPLGEELGWRGFLQPELAARHGWLVASLAVGAVWFVWHVPLWFVESPQAEIPIGVFAGHVMAYALIMGAMGDVSGGALGPAILFHLGVNVVAGVALLGGLNDTAGFYRATLVPYLVVAALVTLWMSLRQCGFDG